MEKCTWIDDTCIKKCYFPFSLSYTNLITHTVPYSGELPRDEGGGTPRQCHNLQGDVYSVGVSDDEKNGGRQRGNREVTQQQNTNTTNVLTL